MLSSINQCLNSLAPGNFEWNFRYVIFKRVLVIDGWGISCEIGLIWMSLDCYWWSVNRDSPTIWCLCAFFPKLLQSYVPFYVKKEKMGNSMCLLEFECAKRLKAHSQAIPESTLVQAMAWCRQATSHYMSQCWPRSLSSYGVTKPQWDERKFSRITIKFTFNNLPGLRLAKLMCNSHFGKF